MNEFSYKYVVLYILLIIGNSLTHEKITGILISFPEIIAVIYLLFTSKTEKAFFFHIVFTISCLAIPFSQITNPEESHYGLFNYSKLKLIGPVGVYHLIMFSFYIRTFRLKVTIPPNSVFYLLYKTIIFLGASGILIGIFGLLFFGYYIEYFVIYTSYILTLYLTSFVLIRLPFESFVTKLSKMLIELMIAAPIAALFVYLLGFTSQYGTEEVSIIIEVVYFSMALIFAYYHMRNFLLPILSFLITGFLLMDGGMGGKGILFMGIILILFLFMAFNKKATGYDIVKRRKNIQLALIPVLMFGFIKLTSYIENSEYNLFLYKLENVTLMVNVFQGIDGINLIPESPRVRIVEIMSIYNELFSNPFFLLFGKGYGSYFSDDFKLLANMDLINAYKDIEISNNKYGGVHDSFSSIPLANGLIGVFLVFRLVIKYIKMINHNFMAYAAIPWLAFTFYYNVQFGIIAMLLLYSSEFYLNLKDERCKKEDIIY
ncbi:hypothetical protein [Flavobacterium granuli]|uniref:O-Antigen ligase n=1 Tax=Flavobacterium granuli TaxID=280093 RepID=A0A1M5SIR3_9FLAO|nr:hypothetical protein [Flavobacterium granuli]PRZ21003.1 hypothetical protein BC624_11019 [Flavobacterium granuli]SHH38426.1 hypothetical protein SAMN05443373_11218 [Flavobacterium granuli]